MNKILPFAALAAAFALATAPARADDDQWYYEQHRNDFITFDKAAEAASQAVAGTVTDVDFEHDWNGDHFEVDVRGKDGNKSSLTRKAAKCCPSVLTTDTAVIFLFRLVLVLERFGAPFLCASVRKHGGFWR